LPARSAKETKIRDLHKKWMTDAAYAAEYDALEEESH
jgi:hypothetical protein